jgi:hypothetical protein
MAYDRVNAMRSWNFLRKEDETHTIATGTTTYALPSDFLYLTDEDAIKLINSEGGYTQLKIVPFRERREWRGNKNVVYIDVANSNIIFPVDSLADFSGLTMNITYQYQPTQLTTSTSPVFQRAYHLILAYYAAKHFWYNDQVEKERAWTREMEAEYQMLVKEMNFWDDNLEHALAPTWRPKAWANLEDGGPGGNGSGLNGFYL